jgi:hypothetical protein
MEEDSGYLREEIERGQDRSWHMWPWGCAASAAFFALTIYGLYRFSISLGLAGSVSF